MVAWLLLLLLAAAVGTCRQAAAAGAAAVRSRYVWRDGSACIVAGKYHRTECQGCQRSRGAQLVGSGEPHPESALLGLTLIDRYAGPLSASRRKAEAR